MIPYLIGEILNLVLHWVVFVYIQDNSLKTVVYHLLQKGNKVRLAALDLKI